jgi:hypothetical protein
MQKNKIVLISVILIIILAILAGVYMFNQNKSSVPPAENNKELQNGEFTGISDQNKILEENQIGENSTITSGNQLVTDDFSIELPVGWEKVVNTVAGVSAMAANPDEIISDVAAQEINFKSYLAVSPDTIAGQTMEEYMQSIKTELQKSTSGAVFTNENDLTINEQSARAVEVNMTQQGIDFKVLIVAVRGNGDDVWVLSYNTVKSSWDRYVEDFAASARSFVLKK